MQDFDYLWSQILKFQIFLERPAVQIQLLGIALSILLGLLTSKWVWYHFRRRFPQVGDWELKSEKLSWREYGAAIVGYLMTPTFSLLLVNLLRYWFLWQGWRSGLLAVAIELLNFFFFFRLFLLSLYTIFPVTTVDRYRASFFAPLFALFITSKILGLSINLLQLFQVKVINLFDTPVTLEAIFVTIAGLYFWIVGASMLEKLLLHIFWREVSQDPGSAQAASLILRYFLMGLGIVLIFGYVGISPTALAAITGGLSVGIGFGLKEVISNFVSGIWLLFEGALKPGDVIAIEGEMSKVERLGVRATTVQVVRDNSEPIIPNQSFFMQNVTTFTGSDRLVYRSLIVGTSYDCDPQKVIQILLQVAHHHPQVLKEPAPIAFFIGFGESSLDFELKFWLDDPLIGKRVTSELGCKIWQAFADNDIEIPYPQRDLHVRSDFRTDEKGISPTTSEF